MGILEFILRVVQIGFTLIMFILIMKWGDEERRVDGIAEVLGEIFVLIVLILLLCAIVFGGNYLIDWIC